MALTFGDIFGQILINSTNFDKFIFIQQLLIQKHVILGGNYMYFKCQVTKYFIQTFFYTKNLKKKLERIQSLFIK